MMIGTKEAASAGFIDYQLSAANKADSKEYAEKHEQHAHFRTNFFHFSCFLRGYQALYVKKSAAKVHFFLHKTYK